MCLFILLEDSYFVETHDQSLYLSSTTNDITKLNFSLEHRRTNDHQLILMVL